MNNKIRQQTIQLGILIVVKNHTIRSAAKIVGLSKSTAHTRLIKYLPDIDSILYKNVRQVLDKHKEERHLLGGMATKMKYLKMKK